MNNGRVSILYRHFPFIGDESWRAAEASECAGEQGQFKEYLENVYFNWAGENEGTFSDENLATLAGLVGLNAAQYNECMDTNKYLDKIRADKKAGESLGVNSTPTLFINGEMVSGLQDYGIYRVKIEKALTEAGY